MSNYEEYKETLAIHPGYYINELVEESGLTQQDFAKRLGTTPKNLSILIHGEQSLSIDIAVKLSRMLGTSTGFWLNLQRAYDEKLAEIISARELEREREVFHLLNYQYFRDSFGLPKNLGETDEQIRTVREFLGVASLTVLEQPGLAARIRNYSERISRSRSVNANAVVQAAMNQALKMELPKYNKKKFEKAAAYAENQIQRDSDFLPKVCEAFGRAGTALVVMPELKEAGVQSFSKKLEGRLLIMVNDQGKAQDRFCYLLFRETACILNGDLGISTYEEIAEAAG